MTSTQQPQTVSSTPAVLTRSKEVIAQTTNATGFSSSNVLVGHSETSLNAIGLLLVALIALVAVSRRGIRQDR